MRTYGPKAPQLGTDFPNFNFYSTGTIQAKEHSP